MADAKNIEAAPVVAQDAKTVGDEGLEVREPTVEVVKEQVDAQVVQPREGDHDKVNVHEVRVETDTVITDPASPLAVQVPDAGRSPLHAAGLPIARLDAPRPEDILSGKADAAPADAE